MSQINDGTLTFLCFGIIYHAHFLSGLLHAFQGFQELTGSGRANICIKRMGELDPKAFGIACRKRLSKEDAKSLLLSFVQSWMLKLETQTGTLLRLKWWMEKKWYGRHRSLAIAILLP
jgi:hypothetical protein